MHRKRIPVLFVAAVVVAVSGVATVSGVVASSAADAAETSSPDETTSPAEGANQTETTTTPDDGPDGHADDPFPSWLPLLLAGGLIGGIAVVGGGLWFVLARVRRFLGR